MPKKMKMAKLAQEVVRRMRNTGKEVWKKICSKIEDEEHEKKWMRKGANSGMRRHEKIGRQEEGGIQRVNRTREEGQRKRSYMKLTGRKNWYRKRRKYREWNGDYVREEKEGREDGTRWKIY